MNITFKLFFCWLIYKSATIHKIFAKNKEIKQKWTQTEKFGNYFCVIFECYYKSYSSGSKTGL